MFYSVDRIEEDVAVCIDDNGDVFNISLELIVGDIKNGSVLIENDGLLCVDTDEENARREANFNLAESLFEN